jgi:hypothetical protein
VNRLGVRYVPLRKPIYSSIIITFFSIIVGSFAPTTSLLAAQVFDSRKADLLLTEKGLVNAQYEPAINSVTFRCHEGKSLVRLEFKSTNLGKAAAVRIRLHNYGAQPLRIFAGLNGSFWVTDYSVLAPETDGDIIAYLQRKTFDPTSLALTYPSMNGVPGGQMGLWPDVDIDAADVHELTLFTLDKQPEPVRVEIKGIEILSPSGAPPDPQEAIVDEFGQYRGAIWPAKVHTIRDLQLRAQEQPRSERLLPEEELDEYGGWARGPQQKATGHFRVFKVEGVWWFVDPAGKLFWSDGVTGVSFTDQTDVMKRPRLFHFPPSDGDFLRRNLAWKYGAGWGSKILDVTSQRLHAWGLNTIGPWSDSGVIRQHRMPYTVVISSKDKNGGIDPYSETWRTGLQDLLRAEQVEVGKDPWCVGVFVDNEIHQTDPQWWTEYYTIVQRLMKQEMPDTLYLGSRLDYSAYPEVDEDRKQIVKIAAEHTDVLSFNLYRFTLEDFVLPKDFDHPIIIGEFHFGALDRGMLHTGLRSVKSQDQRAEAYAHYMHGAVVNRLIVGAHWFQLYDEPTTGRFDGENYQIGLISITDTPYDETIAAVTEVGRHLYTERSKIAASH